MSSTPNLGLPRIASGQAQKHVTFNEAVKHLDALTQISVLSRNVSAPPASTVAGRRYLLSSAPTGEFSGFGDHIAVFADGDWSFFAPQPGWVVWVEDEATLYVRKNDASWLDVSNVSEAFPRVGINAQADSLNRLSVASQATLLSHDGNDHHLKINKNGAVDTASLIFQTGFEGRAEIGLTGGDDLQFKTSSNGTDWMTRLIAPADDNSVRVPLVNSGELSVGVHEAVSIPTPSVSGFFAFHIVSAHFPQIKHGGIVLFDVGDSLELLEVFAGPNVNTMGSALLDGVTGPDGDTNISVQSGAVQIENRRAVTSPSVYRFIFFG